MPQNTLF